MNPYVAIVGKSNTGKTTVIINIIKILKKRGYKVGTIKHHNHKQHFDSKGKDTYRHFIAGADSVIISSPNSYGIFKKVDEEKKLDDLILESYDVDILIVEGYKETSLNKIEIVRKERSDHMICKEDEILALITDTSIEIQKPVFNLNDYEGIANFVEKKIINKGK